MDKAWDKKSYWIQNKGSMNDLQNQWYLSTDVNDEPAGCYSAKLNPKDLRQIMEILVHISHKEWVDSGRLFKAAMPLIERNIFNGSNYA